MGQATWRGSGATPMSALVLPLGGSLSFGLYWVVSAVALPLLRCACTFAASYTACSWGPCWLTIALRYLHARMAALRVLGPSSGWFVARCGKYVTCLFLRLIWLVPCPEGYAWLLQHHMRGASLVLGRLDGMSNVGCTRHPIKEVNAWQWCDFLGRAGLW